MGTVGHGWKDFDAAEKASQGVVEQIRADVYAYAESHLTSYWVYREHMSGHPSNAGQAPSAFSSIITFFLKPGGEGQIEDAIKAGNAAAQKSHWQGKPVDWYSLVNGGYGGRPALAVGHENWADFQPPDPDFFKMLNEVYGQEDAAALGKKFNSGLRTVRSETWRYRPDLSYIPASQ
jgi:hypothetical protein